MPLLLYGLREDHSVGGRSSSGFPTEVDVESGGGPCLIPSPSLVLVLV